MCKTLPPPHRPGSQLARLQARSQARYLRWSIDIERAPRPPHPWRGCVCREDAGFGCRCICHGFGAPRPGIKVRWVPGQHAAVITDITTRESKTRGQLNRERRQREAERRQRRLL